jgi:flagellin
MSAIDAKTSLIAIQGMKGASRDIAQASERLISGKRINRASDDPAGFAQSIRLQAEIGSYNQVRKNINEAMPKAIQAGDTLNQIAGYLVEMRSIAFLAKGESSADKIATYQSTIDEYFTAIADAIALDPVVTAGTFDVQVGIGAAAGDTKTFTIGSVTQATLDPAGDVDVTVDADAAIGALDAALETVLAEVGKVGAIQGTLEFTSDFIDNTILNKTVQYRDLTDSDMALEATNLAAAKIRQDASTAVLAQANSMNRSVADYLLNGALG